MAALPEIAGHEALRRTFARALGEDTMPQSILLHGPQGVGKERLGLWLAQLIVCDAPAAEPCGRCNNCRLVPRLEHPDVHWFFPLPRPASTSPEKLRERLEEHRGAELQKWRETPLRIIEHEKAPAHFLASVRTMQRLASMRPAAGDHSVFVIGDAELMVPQESSPEAANAFLKLLEEPPPTATIILTSSQPGALLPTIRSRAFSARALPVPQSAISRLLVSGGLAPPEKADRIAARARGSVRRAVQLAIVAVEGGPDPERVAGRELLLAALTDGGVPRLAAAHNRRPTGARVDLVGELESLALWLRDLAAVAAGDPEQVADPDALPLLTRAVQRRKVAPASVIRAMRHLSTARDLAQGNVNPQLIVADLLAKLQTELVGGEPPAGSEIG
jgi:DNA polymerase-3 subunit delta'